jgi:DHA2 family multidrug resistance protein
MGNSLGISWLQMLSMHTAARVQSRLVEGLRPDNPVLALRLPDIDLGAIGSVAPLVANVERQAMMLAYTDIYWMLCLLGIAMMPLVLLLQLRTILVTHYQPIIFLVQRRTLELIAVLL